MGVEWLRIVNGGNAEKAEPKEKSGPDVPAIPIEVAEGNEGEGKKEGGKAMKTSVDGAEDMAAIKLCCGEEI